MLLRTESVDREVRSVYGIRDWMPPWGRLPNELCMEDPLQSWLKFKYFNHVNSKVKNYAPYKLLTAQHIIARNGITLKLSATEEDLTAETVLTRKIFTVSLVQHLPFIFGMINSH